MSDDSRHRMPLNCTTDNKRRVIQFGETLTTAIGATMDLWVFHFILLPGNTRY